MMRLSRKKVVVLEMDDADYQMLCDTIGQASKVRSKLYPLLNEQAKTLYGLITGGEIYATHE